MDNLRPMEPNMHPIERALVWILGIIIVGLMLWSAFIKPSDKSIYQPDSKPIENHITRWPFTIDLNFSCSRVGLDSSMKDKNVKSNIAINNLKS